MIRYDASPELLDFEKLANAVDVLLGNTPIQYGPSKLNVGGDGMRTKNTSFCDYVINEMAEQVFGNYWATSAYTVYIVDWIWNTLDGRPVDKFSLRGVPVAVELVSVSEQDKLQGKVVNVLLNDIPIAK